MRVAIIDLGTNSVRFDVHQIGPGGKVRQLHREKLMIRLGQGVFLAGRLDPDAVRRTLETFASFERTARRLHVDRVTAFGTSALREAADSDQLLARIRERTGIDVQVISGAEEARLIARGVLALDKSVTRSAKGAKKLALVDIGGGSTEMSVCRGRSVLHCDSFPLGTARLQQIFLKSTPPKPEPIIQLRRYIKSVILPKVIAEDWGSAPLVVGSSGTIRTLARMLRERGPARDRKSRPLERSALRDLVKEMSAMTTSQLLGLPGMDAKRVDMILAGAVLLEECMAAVGAKRFQPTEYTLRDGVLVEELDRHAVQAPAPFALHLEAHYKTAARLGIEDTHLRTVVAHAELLFNRLRKVHGLDSRWRPYLTAAAILHDVGEAIAPTAHERHSYYVVKNAELPGLQSWETELIAQLCLWHRGGKPSPKKLPFRKKEARAAFLPLLALLRVADALDRGHQSSVAIRSVRVRKDGVELRLAPSERGRAIDLERLRVDQKKELFEDVFGLGLRALPLSSKS